MMRTFLNLALLASLPAWAVGEHIAVTGPAHDQLSETLCISMECSAGHDYTVTSKLVGTQMELKVLGPDSGVRFSMKLPTNGDGRLNSSDAMTATSQLVHAIETPFDAKAAAALEKDSKPAKKSAKLAKRHLHAPVRVAARMRARG